MLVGVFVSDGESPLNQRGRENDSVFFLSGLLGTTASKAVQGQAVQSWRDTVLVAAMSRSKGQAGLVDTRSHLGLSLSFYTYIYNMCV